MLLFSVDYFIRYNDRFSEADKLLSSYAGRVTALVGGVFMCVNWGQLLHFSMHFTRCHFPAPCTPHFTRAQSTICKFWYTLSSGYHISWAHALHFQFFLCDLEHNCGFKKSCQKVWNYSLGLGQMFCRGQVFSDDARISIRADGAQDQAQSMEAACILG